MKLSKQDERELEEAIYLLFVKVSTLPVWFHKYKPTLEAMGTVIISIMNIDCAESKGKMIYEVMFQADVYCSEEEAVSMEEAEYIVHMLKESYKERLIVSGYKFNKCNIEGIFDRRGHYKMAPHGFERVMTWGRIGFSKKC